MNDVKLNKTEAYRAMFIFLENLYSLTNDDSLGGFLGSMQLLSDGSPADPAYWADWERAVSTALNQSQSSLDR
ncbi:MAG: hypothetical protein KIT80_04370 [Chitinophagaceae bacterium]|nr:hypothetical protein [Chitinophagaceae bacterium]MCW5926125.1 hypothetical protein [Chitinophagaceae bacterium]